MGRECLMSGKSSSLVKDCRSGRGVDLTSQPLPLEQNSVAVVDARAGFGLLRLGTTCTRGIRYMCKPDYLNA